MIPLPIGHRKERGAELSMLCTHGAVSTTFGGSRSRNGFCEHKSERVEPAVPTKRARAVKSMFAVNSKFDSKSSLET